MREITTHKAPGFNDNLQILACDEPGPGGANHHYQVIDVSTENTSPDAAKCLLDIEFQNGGIQEVGVTGPTNEALIAIVIDRLSAFQNGAFACVENAGALGHLYGAMACLHQRTKNRVERGVEGQLKP